MAYLGAMAGGIDQAYVKQLSERLELDLSRRFREYSTGNKKKLVLVVSFMHRPRLLILDETTSGLDPLNQQEFYDMVREVRQDGATVFLSSHVLSEVEHICDRVGIIRSGHLVKVASLEDLHRIRMHHVEVEFAGDVPVEAVRRAAGVDGVTAENHRVRCVVRGSFEPLMDALVGAHVVNLSSHEPSLEEAFLAYYSGAEEGVVSPCCGTPFGLTAGAWWASPPSWSCRPTSRPAPSQSRRAPRPRRGKRRSRDERARRA